MLSAVNVDLSHADLVILSNSLLELIGQTKQPSTPIREDWQFQTRIGHEVAEADALRKRLLSVLRSASEE